MLNRINRTIEVMRIMAEQPDQALDLLIEHLAEEDTRPSPPVRSSTLPHYEADNEEQ